MTDMMWKTFQQVAHRCPGLDATRTQLTCRLYMDGYSEADALTGLVNENSWHKVMDNIGEEFTYGKDVELEIMDVNHAISSAVIMLQGAMKL